LPGRSKARRRGDVRELHDVELYEVSPVLFGAHPDARLIGVEASRPSGVEYKAHGRGRTAAADRDGGGDPVLGVRAAGGGDRARRLRRGERLICRRCGGEAVEGATTDTATSPRTTSPTPTGSPTSS
jgi:hypothetical protein